MRYPGSLTKSRGLVVACLLVTGVAIVSAAYGATRTTKAVTLTVFTDQPRAADVEAYAKKHPELDIKIQVQGDNETLPHLRLAIKARSGIPDVTFENGPALYAGSEFQIYAGDLSKYIPATTLNKFVKGTLGACKVGGKVLCVRNDLAQAVLWINTHLFQQFGYKVPQRWQQFQQVGLRLAKEHPGYSIGPFSNWPGIFDLFYGGFQCPYSKTVGPNTVQINMQAPGCKRMYTIIDPLLKAGVLGRTVSVFGSDGAKLAQDDKYLMMVGPSWWGDFVLKPFYKAPKGEWTANQPMAWGNKPRVTGSAGGGVWMIYKNSPNTKQAAQLIRAITTDVPGSAAKPTYPAYGPAVPVWSSRLATDSFYSRNPAPALNAAAVQLSPDVAFVRYNYSTPYSTIIVPGLKAGKSLASMASAVQTSLDKLAKQAGYRVVR